MITSSIEISNSNNTNLCQRLEISSIRIDGGTQSRVKVSEETVAEYTEYWLEGKVFPPIDVFCDGTDYWLGDGYHRLLSAKRAGLADINVNLHQGTLRDAILFSVRANQSHGLKRSAEDKRRAVNMLLEDEEWAKWSDREIARNAGVHHSTVSAIRQQLGQQRTETLAKRGNKVYSHKVNSPEFESGEVVEIVEGEFAGKLAQIRLISGDSAVLAIDGIDGRKQEPLRNLKKIESEPAAPTSVKQEQAQTAKKLGIPKKGLPEVARNNGIGQPEESFQASYIAPGDVGVAIAQMSVEDLELTMKRAERTMTDEQVQAIWSAIAHRLVFNEVA